MFCVLSTMAGFLSILVSLIGYDLWLWIFLDIYCVCKTCIYCSSDSSTASSFVSVFIAIKRHSSYNLFIVFTLTTKTHKMKCYSCNSQNRNPERLTTSILVILLVNSIYKPVNIPSDVCVQRRLKSECAVWSEFSLGTFRIANAAKFLHADYDDSELTVWMCRLIWLFVDRTCQIVRFLMLRLELLFFSVSFTMLCDCECSRVLHLYFIAAKQHSTDRWETLYCHRYCTK